jgi:hypothetical protein
MLLKRVVVFAGTMQQSKEKLPEHLVLKKNILQSVSLSKDICV